MPRLDHLFTELRRTKRKAFMPFVTAGDPDLAFTADVIRELDRRGATLCEVGIPYSDPIADGPVIQASYTRALAQGVRLKSIFEMTSRVAPTLSTPLVTMVSYAIIHRHTPEKYLAAAKQSGIAGAIVPDLPIDEAAALAALCRREDFSLIQLVTPTTPRERALRIAEATTGFLYYVSVTGITGERTEFPPDLLEKVAWLREKAHVPVCVGFGVSRPEQARQLAPAVDGVIVGSALVRRIAAAAERPRDAVIQEAGEFIASLAAALNGDR